MATIILYTGGQRCGKSELAEAEVLNLAARRNVTPLYIATAVRHDEDAEFAARIAAHQARRGTLWHTVEEPLYPSRRIPEGSVVLLDCVTLWCANAMFRTPDGDIESAYKLIETEINNLATLNITLVAVTNEVGLGGVSPDHVARRFADLQGNVNRLLASLARKVVLVISGIPVIIKDQDNIQDQQDA